MQPPHSGLRLMKYFSFDNNPCHVFILNKYKNYFFVIK